ncbi:hypothetical protein PG997_005452 [Apiospora hydei]|uniref:Major facilitator superfamily (MFS) profile domain-containing protein n=1 Tax=Apiospora hydei TaxID=1337664 RepID=A0ABR1X513_9PEZI
MQQRNGENLTRMSHKSAVLRRQGQHRLAPDAEVATRKTTLAMRLLLLQVGLVFLCLTTGSLLAPYFGTRSGGRQQLWVMFAANTLGAVVMVLLSFVRADHARDEVVMLAAGLLARLVEPMFFAMGGPVKAEMVEQEVERRGYSSKARIMYASVSVSYARKAGHVIGPLVAGVARDSLGWTGATRLLAGLLVLGGFVVQLLSS